MAMSNPVEERIDGEGEAIEENNNIIIDEDRNNINNRDKPRFKVGTAILKEFSGTTFRGVITRRFDGLYYGVSYDVDDDFEDMDHEEVERLLENRNIDNYKSAQDRVSRLVQLDMHGERVQERDSESFGHNFPEKSYE